MKLKELRIQRLIGLRELAQKSNISEGTILAIEAGKQKPKRMTTIRQISQALEVPPQMIDEFTPVVGTMDSLVARLVERDGARVQAAIDRADKEGWVSEEQLERELSQQVAA